MARVEVCSFNGDQIFKPGRLFEKGHEQFLASMLTAVNLQDLRITMKDLWGNALDGNEW
jgi:hypothetical protein